MVGGQLKFEIMYEYSLVGEIDAAEELHTKQPQRGLIDWFVGYRTNVQGGVVLYSGWNTTRDFILTSADGFSKSWLEVWTILTGYSSKS